MNTLAERISAAMEKARVAQADLVRATGASAPSVSNWLNGRTKNLKGRNLVVVAELLGVTESWLADGVGSVSRDAAASNWPFESVNRDAFYSLSVKQRQHIEDVVAKLVEAFEAPKSDETPSQIPYIAESRSLGKNPLKELERETAALAQEGQGNDGKAKGAANRRSH